MHDRSLDGFHDLGHANAVHSSRRQDVDRSVEELLEELLYATKGMLITAELGRQCSSDRCTAGACQETRLGA
jgi:hypothetical protein